MIGILEHFKEKLMAKDFLGQELHVGDSVVFVQLGYRNLWFGTISKLTEKTALISHKETNTCSTETKQFHNQLIRVTDNVLNMSSLKSRL